MSVDNHRVAWWWKGIMDMTVTLLWIGVHLTMHLVHPNFMFRWVTLNLLWGKLKFVWSIYCNNCYCCSSTSNVDKKENNCIVILLCVFFHRNCCFKLVSYNHVVLLNYSYDLQTRRACSRIARSIQLNTDRKAHVCLYEYVYVDIRHLFNVSCPHTHVYK